MARYLFIESRDPFESKDIDFCYGLATDLARQGNEVTLFLVQNGVLPARTGTSADGLSSVAAAGVTVLADEFSLKERAISNDRLLDGVKAAPLEVVVDELAAGAKTIWH